jgi:hypothetical protein
MKPNESTGELAPDRYRGTDRRTTDDADPDTDSDQPHPHWLLRSRIVRERLRGGDE